MHQVDSDVFSLLLQQPVGTVHVLVYVSRMAKVCAEMFVVRFWYFQADIVMYDTALQCDTTIMSSMPSTDVIL